MNYKRWIAIGVGFACAYLGHTLIWSIKPTYPIQHYGWIAWVLLKSFCGLLFGFLFGYWAVRAVQKSKVEGSKFFLRKKTLFKVAIFAVSLGLSLRCFDYLRNNPLDRSFEEREIWFRSEIWHHEGIRQALVKSPQVTQILETPGRMAPTSGTLLSCGWDGCFGVVILEVLGNSQKAFVEVRIAGVSDDPTSIEIVRVTGK